MRPERDNIAAPELPGRIHWLNSDTAPAMAALTATGPVLVHFFDFSQLNSVRAIPYLREWHERYREHGLSVIGIHSPRFGFSGDRAVVTEGVAGLGVEHPVGIDADYAIWHDYGCRGWPSLFLWARGGALRWFHFGEGEYRETEQAIQDELRVEDVTLTLPEPLAPLRGTDEPGALLPPPTGEIFPGGSPAVPWVPGEESSELRFDYEAGAAWLVSDGAGEVSVAVDDGPPRELRIEEPGLTPVSVHERHEAHRVRAVVGEELRVWAISFEPGIP